MNKCFQCNTLIINSNLKDPCYIVYTTSWTPFPSYVKKLPLPPISSTGSFLTISNTPTQNFSETLKQPTLVDVLLLRFFLYICKNKSNNRERERETDRERVREAEREREKRGIKTKTQNPRSRSCQPIEQVGQLKKDLAGQKETF